MHSASNIIWKKGLKHNALRVCHVSTCPWMILHGNTGKNVGGFQCPGFWVWAFDVILIRIGNGFDTLS